MKLVIVLFIASGCMKHSDKYCAMHPEDTENCSGGDDASTACLGNDDCIAIDPTKGVCTDDRMCVECTVEDAAACTDGRVCSSNRTCGDCTAHADCASSVCQTNGRCADTTMVAYLAPTGSGTACTQSAPCNDAATAEATARPIIKVSGTISDAAQVLFDARSTTIYTEPGATLTRTTAGSVIEIMNNSTELTIYGLRITGALGGGTGSGNGIVVVNQSDPKLTLDRVLIDANDGSGVRAADGGDITITRSIIVGNFGNQGIVLQNSKFSVTNTIIAQNGRSGGTTGGAVLSPNGGGSRFEFNTVADNISMGGVGNYRAISCATGFDLANNVIINGDTSGCDITYSLFSTNDGIVDTGNLTTGNAMFKSTIAPSDPTFYRLQAGSPAKDKADTAATLMTDIDGNMRPIDGRSDMGADEVAP